ncbi:MAG: hypothetical protein ACRDJP_07570 [Actinomycetota bacterium]
MRYAAKAGRAWRRIYRFVRARGAEARVFVLVCAAGFALLAAIDLTRPDVPAPYGLHVDNGYETQP